MDFFNIFTIFRYFFYLLPFLAINLEFNIVFFIKLLKKQ